MMHPSDPSQPDRRYPAGGDDLIGVQQPTVRLSGLHDLLAILPYVMGFHPSDSVCLVGVRGDKERRIVYTARFDLPRSADDVPAAVAAMRSFVDRNRTDGVFLVGYGAGQQVTPVVTEAQTVIAELDGVVILDVLRVKGDRYWSYTCTDPSCCPPEGMPYDAEASVVAATAVAHGLAALPSRTDLNAVVAPEKGAARAAMREATARALGWVDAQGEVPATVRKRLIADGCDLARRAIAAYRAGGRLSNDDAARFTVLLGVIRVRDEAWTLIDREDIAPHLSLWTDLTRRAIVNVPACASLAAFAAWQGGDGALANVALDRALGSDPNYSMARLIARALSAGMPPDVWTGMTPDELAAAHGEQPASTCGS